MPGGEVLGGGWRLGCPAVYHSPMEPVVQGWIKKGDDDPRQIGEFGQTDCTCVGLPIFFPRKRKREEGESKQPCKGEGVEAHRRSVGHMTRGKKRATNLLTISIERMVPCALDPDPETRNRISGLRLSSVAAARGDVWFRYRRRGFRNDRPPPPGRMGPASGGQKGETLRRERSQLQQSWLPNSGDAEILRQISPRYGSGRVGSDRRGGGRGNEQMIRTGGPEERGHRMVGAELRYAKQNLGDVLFRGHC